MGLGNTLKAIMKEKNISIKDVSTKSGISYNTLYAIITRNNKTIKPDILRKICTVLDITEEELYQADLPTVDEIIKIREENRKLTKADYFIKWARTMGIVIYPICLTDEQINGYQFSYNNQVYLVDETTFDKIQNVNAENIKNLAAALGENIEWK